MKGRERGGVSVVKVVEQRMMSEIDAEGDLRDESQLKLVNEEEDPVLNLCYAPR